MLTGEPGTRARADHGRLLLAACCVHSAQPARATRNNPKAQAQITPKSAWCLSLWWCLSLDADTLLLLSLAAVTTAAAVTTVAAVTYGALERHGALGLSTLPRPSGAVTHCAWLSTGGHGFPIAKRVTFSGQEPRGWAAERCQRAARGFQGSGVTAGSRIGVCTYANGW